MTSDEFQMLGVHHGSVLIAVRIQWIPGPNGRGALRVRDNAIWQGTLWCCHCHGLGYDHGDIDALLEAQRLGVDHAPRVAVCSACGAIRCETCRCCA